jgi:hypothetical protein
MFLGAGARRVAKMGWVTVLDSEAFWRYVSIRDLARLSISTKRVLGLDSSVWSLREDGVELRIDAIFSIESRGGMSLKIYLGPVPGTFAAGLLFLRCKPTPLPKPRALCRMR